MSHDGTEHQTISDLVGSGDHLDVSGIVAEAMAAQQGANQGASADPLMGGVPEGFTTGPTGHGEGPFQGPATAAVFRTSDLHAIAAWPAEKRSRLLLSMMRSGLISEADPRYWTAQANDALGQALAFANHNGIVDPFDAVEDYGRANKSKGSGEFKEQARLAPDYASLAQRVKDTFKSELGRDPDSYEMQQLVAELDGFDRMSHEAEQDLARINFDGGTEEVRAVDPLSRFQQVFEQKYANELDFVQDKKDAVVQRGAVDSMTGLVSQASRSSL